jgi:hypothetical protein
MYIKYISRVRRFSPVNFIPPVLHYLEKWKKKLISFLFIFSTGLYNKLKAAVRP